MNNRLSSKRLNIEQDTYALLSNMLSDMNQEQLDKLSGYRPDVPAFEYLKITKVHNDGTIDLEDDQGSSTEDFSNLFTYQQTIEFIEFIFKQNVKDYAQL